MKYKKFKMDTKMIIYLCVFLLLILCSRKVRGRKHVLLQGQTKVFKVTDFGAKGNGKPDNSLAFLKAWKKACTTNGGQVLVPHGTFRVKSVSFQGPCNGTTIFHVAGTLIAVPGPRNRDDFWIEFRGIDGLKILGSVTATFNGRGPSAWPSNKCRTTPNCKIPPHSIKAVKLTNSVIRGIKSVNSKGFHFHVGWCENLVVRNIEIIAPADSPNTDGIHIAKSKNIKVLDSHISTGDDCVSVGDGSSDINITGVHCGPGHGIRSLGKYKNEEQVRGIKVRNCTLTNTANGLRIKTMAPSSVQITVSDVTFSDIRVRNVTNPIIIDQFYCSSSHCKASGQSNVAIKGVKFIKVRGTSFKKVGVKLRCSKRRPCQNIVLSGVNLKMAGTGQPTTAICSNANKKFIGKKQIPAKC